MPDPSGRWCWKRGKSSLIVPGKGVIRDSQMVRWIARRNIKVLNIPGNRESKVTGIGARVKALFARMFALARRAAERACPTFRTFPFPNQEHFTVLSARLSDCTRASFTGLRGHSFERNDAMFEIGKLCGHNQNTQANEDIGLPLSLAE